MLMKDNKKKLVSLIVNKAKGPSHLDNLKYSEGGEVERPEMKDGVQQDKSIPQEAAAEELLSAIESKSPAAVVEAIKALMELCESEESEPEDSEKE